MALSFEEWKKAGEPLTRQESQTSYPQPESSGPVSFDTWKSMGRPGMGSVTTTPDYQTYSSYAPKVNSYIANYNRIMNGAQNVGSGSPSSNYYGYKDLARRGSYLSSQGNDLLMHLRANHDSFIKNGYMTEEDYQKLYSQLENSASTASGLPAFYNKLLTGYGVRPESPAGITNFEAGMSNVDAALAGADRSVTVNSSNAIPSLDEIKSLEEAYKRAEQKENDAYTALGYVSDPWYADQAQNDYQMAKAATAEAKKAWEDAQAAYDAGTKADATTSGSYDVAKQYSDRAAELMKGGEYEEDTQMDDLLRRRDEAYTAGNTELWYELNDQILTLQDEMDTRWNKDLATAQFESAYASTYQWSDYQAAAINDPETAQIGLAKAEEDLNAYLDNATSVFDSNEANKMKHEHPTEEWTDEQKQTFGWMYVNDPKKAAEYATQINNGLDAQKREEEAKALREKNNGFNLPGWLQARYYDLGSIGNFILNAYEYLDTGTVTSKNFLSPSERAQIIDSAISQNLNDVSGTLPENWFAIGGKGLGDVYQMGNSILMSTVAGLSTGGGWLGSLSSGAMFFGPAASNAYYQAVDQGATPGQAIMFGLASGTFEMLFEEISLDKVKGLSQYTVNTPSKNLAEGVLKWARAVGVSAFIEGDEEINTSIANWIGEAVILQDKAQSKQKILDLMANEGLSHDEAWLRVFKENCEDIAYDGIVGGISGAIHTGAYSGAESIYNSGTYDNSSLETGTRGVTINEQGIQANEEGELPVGKFKAETAEDLIGIASQYGDADLAAQIKANMDKRVEKGKPASITRGEARQLAASITPETYGKATTTAAAIKKGVQGVSQLVDEQARGKGGLKAQTEDVSVDVDGESMTLEDIGYGNKEEVRLKDNNGNIITKTIDEVFDKLPEATRTLITWAKDVLGDGYARAVYLYDQNQDISVEEYVTGMNTAAAIASTGADIDRGSSPLLAHLTDKQLRIAEMIGHEQHQRDLENTQKREEEYKAAQAAAEEAIQTGDVKTAQDEMAALEQGLAYEQEQHDAAVAELEGMEAGTTEYNEQKQKVIDLNAAMQEMKDYIAGKRADLEKLIKQVRFTARKAGTVSYGGGILDGKKVNAVTGPLTQKQQNVANMVNALADVFNFDYVFFDGDSRGTQGAYVGNGKIFININAGGGSKMLAASTLGHELTHALQDYAGEKYNELAQYIEASYKSKYGAAKWNQLIENKLAAGYRREDAVNEIVANSCSEMLMNSKAVQQLAQENSSLFEEIRSRIGDIVAKIKAAYGSDKDTGHAEVELARAFEDLQKYWDDAALAAIENKTNLEIAGKENTTREGGAQLEKIGVRDDGIEVYETSPEIKRLPWNQKRKRIIDLFGTEYRDKKARFTRNGHTYLAAFEDSDIRKNIYGDQNSDQSGYDAKINAAADGDIFDLVENAEWFGGNTETGKNGKAHKGVLYWDYYLKTVQIDGKVFDLLANVRRKAGESFVYNLELYERKEIEAASPHTSSEDEFSPGVPTASTGILTKESPKVKKNSQQQRYSEIENAALEADVLEYFSNVSEDNENYLSPDEITTMLEADPYSGDMDNAEQIVMNLSDLAKGQRGNARQKTYELMDRLLPYLSNFERGNWTEDRWTQNKDFTDWYNSKHPSLYYPGYQPGRMNKKKEIAYLEKQLARDDLPEQDRMDMLDLYDDLQSVHNSTFYQRYEGIEDEAANHFGTTENFDEAGYILQDGRMLDFSGRHWGLSDDQARGRRDVDHEDIAEAFDNLGYNSTGDNRLKFINRGNIRFSPEAPGINLSATIQPTTEQYSQIRDFINQKSPNSFYVDFEGRRGDRLIYTGNVSADRVINDMKNYYQTGETRQQSVVSRFHSPTFYQKYNEKPTDVGVYDIADFEAAKGQDGKPLFQIYAFQHDESEYRDMLTKWGGMGEADIDKLFDAVDAAVEVIKNNLEALDYAWEADIDDRGFSPVKQNSDKLYKVSQDFSTLCRKRILQGAIQNQLQAALNRALTNEEGIAIRDALMAIQAEGKQIEVACALCYVESARMRSPKQIQRFLDNREDVIKDFFAGKDKVAAKQRMIQAEADERQAIYEELGLVRGKGADSTMYDVRDVKSAPLKKLPGALATRIREAKKAARSGYQLTEQQQRVIETAKQMSISDFTTPEGLENLAKHHRDLFDAYTSFIRNATKSKGIENDTWWRAGDSSKIGDLLIEQMNNENGLRSQSWSDFQVKHLMDYIAATIELSTRGAKQHAYTKVPDYVDLMGDTGVMINLSLIPSRDYNGTLSYDDVEGFVYKEAMRLRDKYHATAGTICIGIHNEQIQKLLASMNIDYVIPYHRSGMAAHIMRAMHIPQWNDYQDFQNEKQLSGSEAKENAKQYGVKLLSEDDPLWHEGPKFSDWFDLKRARRIAAEVGKTGKYGVMTGGYAAMQDAAQRYKEICAERGLAPKFSYGRGNFVNEENYWKILIDRKMIDNVTGDIIEQQKIKPIFNIDTIQRILDDEIARYGTVKEDQNEATRRVTEAFLSGKIKGGMSSEEIAKVIQQQVDDISITNITQSAAGGFPASRENPRAAIYQRWAEQQDQTSMELKDNQVAQNRFLVESTELKNLVADLNRQIKELTAEAKKKGQKIDDLKRQMRTTDRPEVREADARKMARQLIREYHSGVKADELAADIKAMGDYLVQHTGEELDYSELIRMSEEIADKVVSNAYGLLEDITGEKQTYKEIADVIKDRKFWLPESMRGELDVLDGYTAFRRKNFGRFKLGEGGESIDSFYEEMQDSYGKQYFPDVNTQGEMLIVMSEIFDQARDEFGNPFAQDQDQIIGELANTILGDAISENLRQMAPTLADKQQAKIKALQAKNKARMDALRQQKNERIADVYRKGIAMRDQALAKERAAKYEKIDALKKHYAAKEQRAAERRSNSKARTKIRKLINDLNARLKSPNQKHYVPVEFVQATIDLLNMINLDTGRSESLSAKLGQLRNMYDSYKQNDTYSVAYDETMSDMLKELAAKIGDTPLHKMTADQLDSVYNALKSLHYVINNAVKVRIMEDEYNAFDLSRTMTQETRSVPKAQSNAFTKWLTAHLRADVMFNRLGGFTKNSTWDLMARMLNDGQLKQTLIQMRLSAGFADLINDSKAMQHFTGTTFAGKVNEKDLVDIGLQDENGNAIKITHDMMVGIYLDLLNEENARHFMYGGKTIPDLQKFYSGKGGFDIGAKRAVGIAGTLSNLRHELNEANRMGEADRAKQIKDEIELTQARGEMYVQGIRENIEKQLTAFDRKWIQATQQLMNQDSKRYLNETTMEVYGIEKANVPNYFPIITDRNFLNTPFESITKDMNLENVGFMKERVTASNPTYAMGTFTVVNNQINKVAQYCGLMPAIRSFNKVYNKSGFGYSDSLKQALTEKFGKEGTQYVENLIADLTGSRKEEQNTLTQILGKLRGNLAQTSLTLNPRVALSQAASYPTAAAELGWGPLVKAFAKGGKSGRMISRADTELIAKYSPLLWLRMQGYADVELGDIKNSNNLSSKVWKKMRWATGWIQAVDGATVGRLWSAAEYWVQDNIKNVQVGTDEYYQEVAKKFNDVVEKTQPNYTTMQRAAILRDPNSLTRTFTMFMTQRLQNFNILYNSVASYQRMRADKANGRNGVTTRDVQMAQNDMIRAVSSQLAQTATYVGFKFLADALLHGLDAYRDKDDDELTAKSISLQLLNNYVDAMIGMFIAGSELYTIIKAAAGTDKFYGLSVNGVDTLNDIITDAITAISSWKDYDPENEKSVQKLEKSMFTFAKSLSQTIGLPLNNAIKIGNAMTRHIQDIANGEFLSFNAGFEVDKDAVGIRMVNALKAGDKDKFDTYADTYGSASSMYSAVEKQVKDGYQAKKQTITKQEAIDLLVDAGEPKRTAEKKVQQWTCKLATGIDYDKIDDQFVADKISEDRAAELYVTYGGMTKADAKSYVQQIKCEKVTGIKYSAIKSEYIAGNLTDAQVKAMLKTYGGKSEDAASKTVLKYSFEKDTEYSWDDKAEALYAGAVSDSKLAGYIQKISLTTYGTKEKAENYVRYLHFQHDYPRYADLSESNVKAIYEAKDASGLSMQQAIDYQIKLSACKGTDKDGDGKTDTNSLRDAKIKMILALPYDYDTKLKLFKLSYTSKQALDAFKKAAGK